MLKTVLVPLDGSPAAETVLPYAEAISRQSGAEIFLLTAIPDVPTSGEYFGQRNIEQEAGEARRYLQEQEKALSAKGIKASHDVIVGMDVATVILDSCKERPTDLIAMSTHGRSGVARWIYGSVTDKVLHHTHLPVLLVRSGEQPPAAMSVKNILVPLDGSPLAASVVPFVRDIAKAFESRVIFFHAVPPMGSYPGISTEQVPIASILEDLQKQAKEYLTEIVEEAKQDGLSAAAAVSVGFAVDEIIAAAHQTEANLIALGTHGRAGIGRWVMGSVTDAVLRRSQLPCLIVRPEEQSTPQQP